MKRASIKDIAEKAGVSIALVSYVLNDKFVNRINKETAKKIKEIAAELNYKPNKIAQSLKSNKTNTIALLVADIANPFTSQVARIIEDETSKRGYMLLIGSSDENEEKLKQLIDLFQKRQVDGFIIAPVENSESIINNLVETKAPVVLIDRPIDNMEIDSIVTNNFEISYQAVNYLINKGKKNIAIFSYKKNLENLKNRVEGYKKALKDSKIYLDSEKIIYIEESKTQSEVYKAIDELNLMTTDALFFTSNKLAIAALKKLSTLDIKIPEELALVTFDESEAFDIFRVPLTHIKQPIKKISKKAVELLIEKIENTNLLQQQIVYNSEIIIGKSV
ncbi:LacI family DNA-binding transcriptional regulator [Apibacter adventoris]|uniref:LacI family transcriptional regulator n=1 Tax=Apibacter adventoris TaxID=1679466 RepID=A0A2S8ADY0_9FLAO|nr:LacI family DNA-binding transcriptional regulator [Apibacter adventoris]PQL93090.1 LacI family transcriptional regulator [Apibacter adventoris]